MSDNLLKLNAAIAEYEEDVRTLRKHCNTHDAIFTVLLLLVAVMTACMFVLRHELHQVEDNLESFKQETYERERSLVSTETAAEPTRELLPLLREGWLEEIAANVPVEEDEPVPYTPAPFNEDYVVRVLTAEAGADEDLCYAVAQCILNASRRDGLNPEEVLYAYGYTGPASWVSEAARRAYDDVLCSGVTYPAVEDALYFYAAAYCASEWHETQRFITEIRGVRFFGGWS